MRIGRFGSALFAVFCLLYGPANAGAAEADEPILMNKLHDLSGRFEISLTPSMSILDKYTRHVGTSLGLGYSINDYLGVELDVAYNFISGDRKLLDEILRTATTLDGVERLALTDLKHMTWSASLGVVFSPFYGKLNFSSEFAVTIHFYMVAGAGVAEYRYSELRHSPPFDPLFGDNQFHKQEVTYPVKPTGHIGGGLRFHFNENWGMKVEIRDILFYDQGYKGQINEGLGVQERNIDDFVHTVFLRLGAFYAF